MAVRSTLTLRSSHLKSFFPGLMEPQRVFADDTFVGFFAEPGRDDCADVGRERQPGVSERARAEEGRAEAGLCLPPALLGSGSEERRAFADVGRRGPPAG